MRILCKRFLDIIQLCYKGFLGIMQYRYDEILQPRGGSL